MIDIAIFPHHHNKLKKELTTFKKKARYKILELKDGQALLILGPSKKIIK